MDYERALEELRHVVKEGEFYSFTCVFESETANDTYVALSHCKDPSWGGKTWEHIVFLLASFIDQCPEIETDDVLKSLKIKVLESQRFPAKLSSKLIHSPLVPHQPEP